MNQKTIEVKRDTIPLASSKVLRNTLTQDETINLIKKYFGNDWQMAVKVSECESHLNPNAVSKTQDIGLFQINLAAHGKRFPKEKLFDPEYNIWAAHTLWIESGKHWETHWRSSAKCWRK